jgi:hypothetical protein
LFDVFDKAPPFVKTVKLVVFTSFWHSWSTSLPFFIGTFFASLSWTSHVMVLSVRVVWYDIFVSPIVDTVSSITRTLLSKIVNLITTSVESFEYVEFTFKVHTVHGQLVVTPVQVVVWIGDFSAIIQVWIDVDSVTFVGQSRFTLRAWEVFW